MAWSASVTLVWWHLTPHWSVPLASTVTAKRMCELPRTSNSVFFITFECMENTLFTILGRSVTVCINSPVILCYTASSNINMQHFNIFTTELMVLFQFFSAENGVTNFGLILCLWYYDINLVPRAFVTLVQRNGKTNDSGKKHFESFWITGFLLFPVKLCRREVLIQDGVRLLG